MRHALFKGNMYIESTIRMLYTIKLKTCEEVMNKMVTHFNDHIWSGDVCIVNGQGPYNKTQNPKPSDGLIVLSTDISVEEFCLIV